MPYKPKSHAERLREKRGRSWHDKEGRGRRGSDAVQVEADRLRKTQRWRKLRKMKLSRNPLCEECRRHGVREPAMQVHHIKPIVLRPELAFEIDNLAALCTTCHARESARERKGGDR